MILCMTRRVSENEQFKQGYECRITEAQSSNTNRTHVGFAIVERKIECAMISTLILKYDILIIY